jgi:hypothetical protein
MRITGAQKDLSILSAASIVVTPQSFGKEHVVKDTELRCEKRLSSRAQDGTTGPNSLVTDRAKRG